MRFSTLVVATFAGFAIAAPAAENVLVARDALDLVARQEPTPTKPEEKPKKKSGGKGKWFAFGVLAAWAADTFNIFGRDVEKSDMSFTDLGEFLADDAVKFLSQHAGPNEATVCADIPYFVQNNTAVREIGGFNVTDDVDNSTYDCFILSAPNVFVVDLTQGIPTPDSVAVNPGPGSWNETTGVLVL